MSCSFLEHYQQTFIAINLTFPFPMSYDHTFSFSSDIIQTDTKLLSNIEDILQSNENIKIY